MSTRGFWAKGFIYIALAALIPALFLMRGAPTGKLDRSGRSAAQSNDLQTKAASSSKALVNASWSERYRKLPMAFVANEGQASPETRFTSQGKGYSVLLANQGAILALREAGARSAPGKSPKGFRAWSTKQIRKEETSVLALGLAGATLNAPMIGLDKLPGRTDFFIGDNRQNWRTNVPSYSQVKYEGVYPGVDLLFYGSQQHLEYDFNLAPGANAQEIALNVRGAKELKIGAKGALEIRTQAGTVEFEKPLAYQEIAGQRKEVAANFELAANGQIRFSLAAYDHSAPLVIDPVLNYSTYLGGSANGDAAYGIAVDASGDAYVAGVTYSTTFPNTSNAYNQNAPGPSTATNGAVFVTEMDPTGATELYSTYLSGSGGESGYAVAVDSSENIYVTGVTYSIDYPTTTNGYNPGPLASNTNGTAFLSVINPAASGTASLVYSTFLGGSVAEVGNGVAVDANQNAYITGETASPDFPIVNGYQTTLNSTSGNAFLARIDATKTGAASLIYSTYLGGTGNGNVFPYGDEGTGVAVDTSSVAYITGVTSSTDFPTTSNGYLQAPLATATNNTVFVAKIDTTKTGTPSLVYSSYLSGPTVGSSGDYGFGIALGPGNVAYVVGQTLSSDFPTTAGSYPSQPDTGSGVAFLSLVDTTQSGTSSLKYSSLLGGNNGDEALGVRADTNGNAYIVGATSSANFPVTPGAFQPMRGNVLGSAFVSEMNPGGNGTADLVYSTFLGGSNTPDFGNAIAIDSNDNAYVTGSTSSTTFPIFPNPGAFQTTLSGAGDAYITKLTLQANLVISPMSVTFSNPVLIGNTSSPQTVTLTNETGATLAVAYALSGTNPGDFAAVPGGATPCPATLPAAATPCTINVTFTPSINGAESANLVFSYTAYGNAATQTVTLSGTGTTSAVTVSPTGLTFSGQLVTTTSASQPVTLTNNSASALTITSIAASGDFGETNMCGASLAGNSSCMINVTFAPTSTNNPLTGTLTITDSDASSPQTVTLTGTGWDYSLSATPPSITVTKGQTSQPVAIGVTGLGGFTGTVSLTCSGAPTNSACAISPNSVAPGSSGNLTLATKAFIVAPEPMRTPPASGRRIILFLLAFLAMMGFFTARRWKTRIGLAGALLVFLVAGCSSTPGTPSGPFTLTVTGSSGGVTHTVTVTGTVN
ncbi:MAG TPA: SBBP repeat-containing protein [Verrucomicrobiae bacterium]|nr:SBBP repeat-containing protein [Verrucomicrobiae bacterium]